MVFGNKRNFEDIEKINNGQLTRVYETKFLDIVLTVDFKWKNT